jgi:hypothetical protein
MGLHARAVVPPRMTLPATPQGVRAAALYSAGSVRPAPAHDQALHAQAFHGADRVGRRHTRRWLSGQRRITVRLAANRRTRVTPAVHSCSTDVTVGAYSLRRTCRIPPWADDAWSGSAQAMAISYIGANAIDGCPCEPRAYHTTLAALRHCRTAPVRGGVHARKRDPSRLRPVAQYGQRAQPERVRLAADHQFSGDWRVDPGFFGWPTARAAFRLGTTPVGGDVDRSADCRSVLVRSWPGVSGGRTCGLAIHRWLPLQQSCTALAA